MWEEKKNCFFFWFNISRWCVCMYVGEKMPPMQLLTAAVWLMDGLLLRDADYEMFWLRSD